MAMIAPKPCRHPGCGILVVDGSGYCGAHLKARRAQSDRERGNSSQRGYGWRWRKVRAGHLRSHPLCEECKLDNVITPATIVDHVIPHKGDQELFWDPNNRRSLCERHHNIKTASEDGGWGRG